MEIDVFPLKKFDLNMLPTGHFIVVLLNRVSKLQAIKIVFLNVFLKNVDKFTKFSDLINFESYFKLKI